MENTRLTEIEDITGFVTEHLKTANGKLFIAGMYHAHRDQEECATREQTIKGICKNARTYISDIVFFTEHLGTKKETAIFKRNYGGSFGGYYSFIADGILGHQAYETFLEAMAGMMAYLSLGTYEAGEYIMRLLQIRKDPKSTQN